MFRKVASSILPCASILVASLSVFAQSPTTGSITGRVIDPNGAVIARAEISVKSVATGEERTATSNDQGNYLVPMLPPGMYRLIVRVSGFAVGYVYTEVFVTESSQVDMKLERAGVDTVTINIDPLLRLDSSTMGRVVGTRAVSESPLATRNFTQILALSPGTSVALPNNTAVGRNSQNISVVTEQ